MTPCAAGLVVAYMSINTTPCAVRCDALCYGYGQINASWCGVCISPNDPQPTAVPGDSVKFTSFTPQAEDNGGCTRNNVCLACPGHRTIHVASHTTVQLSGSCTAYTPLAPDEFGAHLIVDSGATDVKIIGPGTVQSAVFPLSFVPPVFIHNVTFAPVGAGMLSTAITVTSPGLVVIDEVHAPNFRALASIYGLQAKPLVLSAHSKISGTAAYVLAGLGHVSGYLDVTCRANEIVVLQELYSSRTDGRQITTANCNLINLTALLGFYGVEYERMLFNDYDTIRPPWRAVRIAVVIASMLVLILLLGWQGNLADNINKLNQKQKKNN